MDDSLFLGLPLAVALALAAFVLGLLGLAGVLVSLGKPAPLRVPGDGDALHPGDDRGGVGHARMLPASIHPERAAGRFRV